ncbi:MAG: hypothetical protein S4CHLAM102_05420 [Chlamydiia bacterium]|nr:hypothetical protein [Chlamydiia bacterium]
MNKRFLCGLSPLLIATVFSAPLLGIEKTAQASLPPYIASNEPVDLSKEREGVDLSKETPPPPADHPKQLEEPPPPPRATPYKKSIKEQRAEADKQAKLIRSQKKKQAPQKEAAEEGKGARTLRMEKGDDKEPTPTVPPPTPHQSPPPKIEVIHKPDGTIETVQEIDGVKVVTIERGAGRSTTPESKYCKRQGSVRRTGNQMAGPYRCEGSCGAPPMSPDGDYVYFVSLDALFWMPKEGGLGLSIGGVPETPSTTQPTEYPKIFYPQSRVAYGFKVGTGIVFPHDNFDMLAEYTYFIADQGTNFLTITNAETIALFPPVPEERLTYISQVNGAWDLTLNNIDLNLARAFWNSGYLTMRPNIGFKGSWQTQKLSITYQEKNTVFEDHLRLRQKYWGIGLRAADEFEFLIVDDIGIYCNFAFSALYSHFANTNKIRTRNIATGTPYTLTSYNKSSFYNVQPVFELTIGGRLETWFSDRKYHILIQAGWEFQEWWGQNNFDTLTVPTPNGNLTLEGLSLKVRLDF